MLKYSFGLVAIILGFLGLIVIFNYDSRDCKSFKEFDTGNKATCGLDKFVDSEIGGRIYESYVGYGIVEKLTFRNKMYLTVIIPFSKYFSYRVVVEMAKGLDGEYMITEENNKRVGIFENNRVIKFGENNFKEIEKEIMGKEVSFFYLVENVGSKTESQWKKMVADSVNKKEFLMIKGLFNMNNLYASQIAF